VLRRLTQAWVATPFSVLYIPSVLCGISALDTSEVCSNTGLDKVLQPFGDIAKMNDHRYRVCYYTEHGHCEGSRLILFVL